MGYYQDTISECRKLGEEFRIPAIEEAAAVCNNLFKENKLIFTVISLGGLSGELLQIAEMLFERELFYSDNNRRRFDYDWCITFQYGEEGVYWNTVSPEYRIELSDDWVLSGQALIVTLPIPLLKDRKIVFINTSEQEILCSDAVTASDRIILLTSATTAFTRNEKEWMESFIRKQFDTDRFFVYLCGIEKLLNDKDEWELRQYAAQMLAGFDGAKILTTSQSVLEEICAESAKDASRARIIKNLVSKICKILNSHLRDLPSEEDYARAEQQLNNSLQELIQSGEITCENVLNNHIQSIQSAVMTSAEKYADDIYRNIKDVVVMAKRTDDVEEKIQPYLIKAWNHFTKETARQIKRDYEVLSEDMTKTMEEDIKNAFREVDQISLGIFYDILTGEIPVIKPQVDYEKVDEAALASVSKNARNLMILSIPTLFIAPELGLAALLGSGILFKTEKKKMDETYRQGLLRHVEAACSRTRRMVSDKIICTLEKESGRMKEVIRQGYENLAEILRDQLKQSQVKAKETAKDKERINEVLHSVLPSMLEGTIEQL